MRVRRQLTLFVPAPESLVLEAVRRQVDPVQHRLIAAHVTLCREDELARFPDRALHERLGQLDTVPLTITLAAVVPFDTHGVLMPCIAGESDFSALRAMVLGEPAPRRHAPHLTLAHPRNPRSPHNAPATYETLPVPLSITFAEISLIEQTGHEPWQRLETYALGG